MFDRNRSAGLSRRDVLRLSAVGALGLPVSGWLDRLAVHAAESQPKHKNCILLFMSGGPSHIDTFDPKPGNASSAFKPIATAVPGIQLCDPLPRVAKLASELAVIRGMSTSEGSHGRARYYMHTGYREGVGGVVHPSLGAIASRCLGTPEDHLPNFVAIGGPSLGAGYAGPLHSPVEVGDPARGIENLKPTAAMSAFDRRAGLLEEIEKGFVDRLPVPAAQAHQATYRRAAQLMHSEKAKAFDLSLEPAALRDEYGRNRFGEGCLLARRLVENGVSFVEVTLGGWDTHRDNARRVKDLCGALDPALAALLADLKRRGLLETTLVVWMGEFGRGPNIGKQGGRDHYPRAWTTVLAGAGIKGGQVVGQTDRMGGEVQNRQVSGVDFMATVCTALGIDYTKNFYSRDGRPMRLVDKGEQVIRELF